MRVKPPVVLVVVSILLGFINPASALMNGKDETGSELVVPIIFGDNGQRHCSGALIAPRVVMTAGHCVMREDGFVTTGKPIYGELADKDPRLFVGKPGVVVPRGGTTEKARVMAQFPAKNYEDSKCDASGCNASLYDFAILILDKALSNKSYKIATSAEIGEVISQQTPLIVLGYGLKSYEDLQNSNKGLGSDGRPTSTTGVARTNFCCAGSKVEAIYKSQSNSVFQTLLPKNSPQGGGDSGSPVWFQKNGEWIYIGATSATNGPHASLEPNHPNWSNAFELSVIGGTYYTAQAFEPLIAEAYKYLDSQIAKEKLSADLAKKAAEEKAALALIAEKVRSTPGSACSKSGKQQVISGEKFFCVKRSSKLVWSKGVKVAVPIATPSANPTPASIKSFAELPARISDIQYLSWMALEKAMTSSPVQDSPIEIKVDSNTTKFSNKTSEAVRLVQKVFHGSKLPTKAWMIFYTATDQASNNWAASEFSKLMGVVSTSNSLSPRASSSNEAVVPLSLPNDDFTKSGGAEAHEYLHAVQFAQFIGSNMSPYVAPRWLFEGGGQFIQDFTMYGNNYQEWVIKTSGSQLKTYDLKFFEDFLTYNFPIINGPDGDPWFYTSTWPNQRVYDVGALVYQVLIAVNGPTPVMSLFKDMSVTGNFDISFKNVYGISWSDAKPLVAKAIFGIVNR